MKYIIPLIAITASVLYIRHCIKDGHHPPEECRLLVCKDRDSLDEWLIPEPELLGGGNL
jgi:hypothetical protein